MNEAETRAEHIDLDLKAARWSWIEGSRVLREHGITLGRLQGGSRRAKAEIANDVLVYRNTKLAVIEAKAWDKPLTEGVGQAKSYAAKLSLRFVKQGVDKLDQEKLSTLLRLRYRTLNDDFAELGKPEAVRQVFVGFQRHLYAGRSGPISIYYSACEQTSLHRASRTNSSP